MLFRSQFFHDLLGVSESEFQKNPEHVRQAFDGSETLRNLTTGETFKAGRFRSVSLGELRQQCPTSGPGGGTFSLIATRGSDFSSVDVGALQANPLWREAVFQVASNFNALELCGPGDRWQMEHISNYVSDRTQGPYASVSAAPGLVARHYYAFYDPASTPDRWRQQFDGLQIELLAKTRLPVRNGYVCLQPGAALPQINPLDVQVGQHASVQVTFGRCDDVLHERVTDPAQLIDQVFTATIDMNGANREIWPESIARALLKAAYEGTLRAAWSAGKKKVMLTLVGGGAFRNPRHWIEDAIVEQKTLIATSGLDVTLNLFRDMPTPRLTALAHDTGGSIRVFD